MKGKFKTILGILFLTFAFISSNYIISTESFFIGNHKGSNLVYASPKKFGGFKSGLFKSSKSKSGGFKSGLFKSSKSKTNGKNNSSNPINGLFSNKKSNYSSTHTRSFIPFFIPWGRSYGLGTFSMIKLVFDIILIAVVVMIILKFMRRRK